MNVLVGLPASRSESLTLIHTGLQPGDQRPREHENRFNGFSVHLSRKLLKYSADGVLKKETVKTVLYSL